MNAQPEAVGRTAWARNLAAPVRDFLSTETGGAVVLLCAARRRTAVGQLAVVGLLRRRLDHRPLDPPRGRPGISQDLRHWVNEGLMTFFFLVARPRGQARARPRAAARAAARSRSAIAAALGGMAAAGPDLPRVQRRRLRRRRLGRRDVDRHGLRARRARAGGSRRHAAAGAAAHARDLRRPRRAARDRHRLHGRRRRSSRSRSPSPSSPCCSRCGTRRSHGGGRPP